ncbi:MAG: class I SAM-dependent methyltransferase [Desulfovibrionales bacterium]|nr:class I SAM-dependent methyltransferase [Desulfovibrionales bacterium]
MEPDKKAALFGEKLSSILNYGALNAAMGIGYASGAFEALAQFDAPASCDDIAAAAGLDARYLLEWLGVMVSGGIVEVSVEDGQHAAMTLGAGTEDASAENRFFQEDMDDEPEKEELFFLPKEYVPFLTHRGGSQNLGVYTQEIPLLSRCVLQDITQGMRTGEGVGYHRYKPFYSFMEQLSHAKDESVLMEAFLPSVENGELVQRLTQGIHVCDVGCGDGVTVLRMAQAFPKSQFVGFDIDEGCIERAEVKVSELGLSNAQFVVQDAANEVMESNLYDYVMAFDSIHDQTRPFEALKNIQTMLKDGGIFSMVDIAAESSVAGNKEHPMGAFLYTVSLMHCMPVGLVDNGMGLGMMWGRQQAVTLCSAAGFSDVAVLDIPGDGFNAHYLCRK